MRVVFFGSSDFSLPPLESLCHSSHTLVGVVTVPAKPKGRGQEIKQTEVYEWAARKKVTLLCPEKLKTTECTNALKDLTPDLFLVASYGKILPEDVLRIPKRFALNIHPSLLPKYRGAAPLNWQLINGESSCGVTFFRMDAGMDSGDMVWQKSFSLSDEETAETLGRRLSEEAATALPRVLDQIEKGSVDFTPQRASDVSFAPKLKKTDGLLNWSEPAKKLHDLVRGLVPWPCAQATFRGEPVKILKTRLGKGNSSGKKPGMLLTDSGRGGLSVATGYGVLIIERIQKAGKRVVTAEEFMNGERLKPDEKFD